MTLAFGLSSKEAKKIMISFAEGLGALEFQMLVYRKVYQGLRVNSKASAPIALCGLFGRSFGEKTQWRNHVGSGTEATVIP